MSNLRYVSAGGKRELERQLTAALFERTVLSPPKVSALLRQLHPEAETIFKDTYLLDFLNLPEIHSDPCSTEGHSQKK
jgi:predicted nuclease of restriction endonuclease-like (RecB) superfamily